MIDLIHPKHHSATVDMIGFEGENRGLLWVQFHDGKDRPTTLGFYRDVPRALFNRLESDRAPATVLNRDIKAHFEWSIVDTFEHAEIRAAREHPDPTLPDEWAIPADTPNTVAAIDQCKDKQRVAPEGLFT
jgi:hypothetical protein